MNKFEFINGNLELLDLVQPLWQKLNQHHEAYSTNFKDKFNTLTFQTRKAKFTESCDLIVSVDLIKDLETSSYIGYCISTVTKDLVGEIDSLFLEEKYRKYGLGDILMSRALDWLDSNNVKRKIIGVAEGNENVLSFYKKYGFYKRTIILEQIIK